MHFQWPKPVNGWRALRDEVAIVVVGVLIALGAGQIVQFFTDRDRAGVARESIQAELKQNLAMVRKSSASLAQQYGQLQRNLLLLQSSDPDEQVIASLRYVWDLPKSDSSAWNAAKINGSLALIQPRTISQASYFYESEVATDPLAYGYFTDMDAAAALVDHARAASRLTPLVREKLADLTVSALGRCGMLIKLRGYEREALRATDLRGQ